MKLSRLLVIGLACLGPALALAQWQWVDKEGRKVFSDSAPPPEIPARNIIKQPGGTPRQAQTATAAASSPASAPASASARPAASVPRISGKDPVLEARKREADAAEAQKRKAEEERLAGVRAEHCTRAKRSKATIDSGVRVATTNDKGEREVMSDAQRAAESKRLQGILDADCKGV
jgi:hypothetical protein